MYLIWSVETIIDLVIMEILKCFLSQVVCASIVTNLRRWFVQEFGEEQLLAAIKQFVMITREWIKC